MVWKIEFTKSAAKQFKKLDNTIQKRVITFLKGKIQEGENPRAHGKALKGGKLELWRYRVSDYRLICNIEDTAVTVLVLAIGHRRLVYQKR